MHRLHRERRQTYCNVISSALFGRGVLNPLAFVRDHSLARAHIKRSAFVRDTQRSFQHNCEFLKLRSLPWLRPSLWASHMSDANARRLRVNPSDIFVDELRLVPRRLNGGWFCNECWHG